jgi:energy-coupling factor transporter ATP-binding protein EcfA2
VILDHGEPAAGPWRVMPLVQFAAMAVDAIGPVAHRPRIVAVDGRTASGKTTLARRLAGVVASPALVHTDDIAWWHSAFDWSALMADGVLAPVRRAEAVSFRPPAWEARGRAGAVTVARDTSLLIIEGAGAGRREIVDLIDAVIWVQSDRVIRDRREAARVAAGETTADVSKSWMSEEVPFIADQRPWERAMVVVSGTPSLVHDADTEVVVADPPGRTRPPRHDDDSATRR